MVQSLEGIAEYLCYGVNAFARTDDKNLIRKFQTQIETSGELEFSADDTACGHSIMFQGERSESFAKNLFVRHKNAAGFNLRMELCNGLFKARTDQLFHQLDIFRESDDVKFVAFLQNDLSVRH